MSGTDTASAHAAAARPPTVRRLGLRMRVGADAYWLEDGLVLAVDHRAVQPGAWRRRFRAVDPADGRTVRGWSDDDIMACLRAAGAAHDGPAAMLPVLFDRRDRARVVADGALLDCDLAGGTAAVLGRLAPAPAVYSPDGRRACLRGEGGLWLWDCRAGTGRLLAAGDLGRSPDTDLRGTGRRIAGLASPPMALWSPDGRFLLTHATDDRDLPGVPMVQHVPGCGGPPRVHTVRSAHPGDAAVARVALCVVDVASGAVAWADHPPLLAGLVSPVELGHAWWSGDGRAAYFLSFSRGQREVSLWHLDPVSGATRRLVTERGEGPLFLWTNLGEAPIVHVCGDGGVVWYSERSGHGHLYHVPPGQPDEAVAITRGDWTVRDLLSVDEAGRSVCFTAGGLAESPDPYFRQVCRVGLDGTGFRVLAPDMLDQAGEAPAGGHSDQLSPLRAGLARRAVAGTVLISASSVEQPPQRRLLGLDGRIVVPEPEPDWEPDPSEVPPPLRFSTAAADGKTRVHGVLFRPRSFDPAARYPLVDFLYPGPQRFRTPKRWEPFARDWAYAQALADLGFIVMMMDGAGTPGRSRAFHQAFRGRIQACGLGDHVAAIRELARRHPYIDLSRVGALGHSAGGYAVVRALVEHPDLFRVGVSSSGNHDLRRYTAFWGETYHGVPADTDYADADNTGQAARLRGRLLLVAGELDDNVHIEHCWRLVEALVRADRDFDLLVVPNEGHGVFHHPYVVRRVQDYFLTHLAGQSPAPDAPSPHPPAGTPHPLEVWRRGFGHLS